MEAIPQDEMVNSRGMKVFVITRYGLPEDFVYFRDLCGVHLSPLNLLQIVRSSVVLCVSGLRSSGLSARVRQQNSCTSCIQAQNNASITRTGRND